MKANEIRSGNIVECFGVREIEYLVKEGVHFKDGNGASFYSLKPIPLTEEWLVKFGFEKLEDVGFKHDNVDFVLYGSEGEYSFCTNEGWDINDRIKYVHQLQNLFFALTGEELILEGKL